MIHRCRSCGLKCRVLCVDLTAPFAVPSERAPPSQFCPHHSPPWLYAEFLSVFTPYFVICKAPGRLGGPSVAVHVPAFPCPFLHLSGWRVRLRRLTPHMSACLSFVATSRLSVAAVC